MDCLSPVELLLSRRKFNFQTIWQLQWFHNDFANGEREARRFHRKVQDLMETRRWITKERLDLRPMMTALEQYWIELAGPVHSGPVYVCASVCVEVRDRVSVLVTTRIGLLFSAWDPGQVELRGGLCKTPIKIIFIVPGPMKYPCLRCWRPCCPRREGPHPEGKASPRTPIRRLLMNPVCSRMSSTSHSCWELLFDSWVVLKQPPPQRRRRNRKFFL